MATQTISRSIFRRPSKSFSVPFTHSFASSSPLVKSPAASRHVSTLLNRSRPLISGLSTEVRSSLVSARDLSTQATSSSLTDSNPNWSNRSSKETLLFDGCDFEHWLVVMEEPAGDLSRDEIIDYYIKTLAHVVGSEEEARMKIYSVSHRCYYAFGALVSEDVVHMIEELPNVRCVLPDSYLDVENKDYGGEPFIDGKAVPYDPKYHEEWIKNNAASEFYRNERRNFETRRENVRGNQNTGYQGPPPNQVIGGGAAPPNMNQNYQGPSPPPNMIQYYQGPPPPPPNMGQSHQGPPPSNYMYGGWYGNFSGNWSVTFSSH